MYKKILDLENKLSLKDIKIKEHERNLFSIYNSVLKIGGKIHPSTLGNIQYLNERKESYEPGMHDIIVNYHCDFENALNVLHKNNLRNACTDDNESTDDLQEQNFIVENSQIQKCHEIYDLEKVMQGDICIKVESTLPNLKDSKSPNKERPSFISAPFDKNKDEKGFFFKRKCNC